MIDQIQYLNPNKYDLLLISFLIPLFFIFIQAMKGEILDQVQVLLYRN